MDLVVLTSTTWPSHGPATRCSRSAGGASMLLLAPAAPLGSAPVAVGSSLLEAGMMVAGVLLGWGHVKVLGVWVGCLQL